MPIQQQYPLPANRNPRGTRCLMIDIPDDDEYERLFISAIVRLTWWFMYDRDNTHFGQVVAGLWKAAIKTIRDCQSQRVQAYGDYEEMPRFKDKCQHDLFYIGCDDTEHKIAFVGDIPASGITSEHEGQPAAGGGTQEYCKQFQANNVSLIPSPVSTGDVITVSAADGSGYDGAGTEWYCPTGNQLFITCQAGTGFLRGTDPLPTSNHMSLIVKIGANYYPIAVGSPLTVPGGVSNAQAWIQVNDLDLTDNLGMYSICYTVQNNQAATWSHVFNFALDPEGFHIIPVTVVNGTFSAGLGFIESYNTVGGDTAAYCHIGLDAGVSWVLTGFDWTYETEPPYLASLGASGIGVGDNFVGMANILAFELPVDGGHVRTLNISPRTLSKIGFSIELDQSMGSGKARQYSIVIRGQGTNPFA